MLDLIRLRASSNWFAASHGDADTAIRSPIRLVKNQAAPVFEHRSSADVQDDGRGPYHCERPGGRTRPTERERVLSTSQKDSRGELSPVAPSRIRGRLPGWQALARLLLIRRLTEYATTYFHSFGNKSASQSSLFISGAQFNETVLKERLEGSDRLSGRQQASGSNRAEQG